MDKAHTKGGNDMTKKELRTAQDNEIIMDYINSYCNYALNMNFGRGTKAIGVHLKDLDGEMLKRGLLTEEQIHKLNL
jgi:hypothetical protein